MNYRKNKLLLLPTLLLTTAIFLWPFAGQPAQCGCTDPKEAVARLVSLFVNWNGTSINQAISNEAAQYIDYDLMSQLVLGEDQWQKLSAVQQHNFVAAFRRLIEQRYYVRWHRIFKNGKLSYDGADVGGSTGNTPSGGIAAVKTEIIVGQEVEAVTWRLHSAKGSYKVISLTTDHRDLLEILHPRFSKVLAKNGFEGLMTWIGRKASAEESRHAGGGGSESSQ